MVPIQEINKRVKTALYYAAELDHETYTEALKGCKDCSNDCKVAAIYNTVEALMYKVNKGIYDGETKKLYAKLVSFISVLDYDLEIDPTIRFTDVSLHIYNGIDTFLELLDTPSEYLGYAGFSVRVRIDRQGLEFTDEIGKWGFIHGDITEQEDLMDLLSTKADIGDGLLTPVEVHIVGSNAVVSAVSGSSITWKIGIKTITVPSPQTFPINDATDNYFRKDRIVLTLTGMELLEGVETQSVAIPPNVPIDATSLVIIDIYGDQINSGNPNPPVDLAVPKWTVYGSVPFGKYGNGQEVPAAPSAFEQYREAWTNIPHPNYLAPTAQLTSTPPTSGLQIGQTINVNLSLAFTQRDGGSEQSREIRKNGTPLSGSTDTIVISSTPVSYQGIVNFGQGAVKNNAAGVPDPVGRIEAGSVLSNTINYSGIYPYFFLKRNTPITASDMATAIANGQATLVIQQSTGTITIPYAPNGEYMAVAYPSTSTTKTRWYVTALSQGDIPGGVFGAANILPVDSPQGYFSGVNYKIHVTPLLTNTGAANIELRNN